MPRVQLVTSTHNRLIPTSDLFAPSTVIIFQRPLLLRPISIPIVGGMAGLTTIVRTDFDTILKLNLDLTQLYKTKFVAPSGIW